MSQIVLFDPLTKPCKGMNASLSPVSLPVGVYPLLQNVRISRGVIERRDGQTQMTQDSTNKLPDGWVVAAEVLYVMDSGVSTPVLVAAVDNGTVCTVHYSTDFNRTDGSNVNFYQATASSGKWGDTRLATGKRTVAMSVVKSPTRYGVAPFNSYSSSDTDLVLCSDGDTAIVFPLTAGDARIIKEVWRTENTGAIKQECSFPYYFTMTSGGIDLSDINVGDTGTDFNESDTYSVTGGTVPSITFETTNLTAGDGLNIDKSSSSSKLCAGAQLNIVYACPTDPYIWNRLKLNVSDGVTVWTVFDENSSYRIRYTSVNGEKGVWMATFQLDHSVIPATTNITNVQVRWNDSSAPSSQTKIYLMGIMGGGTIGGGGHSKVSYYSSGPFTESEAVGADGEGEGASLGTVGVGDPRHHYQIPVVPYVRYAYNVFYEAPPQSPTDKIGYGSGLDYALFYFAPYGSTEYSLIDSAVIATYSGSWSNTYTVESVQKKTITNTVLYPRSAPKEFHRPIPPHTCAVSASNRLIVGSPKFASTIGGTSVTNRSGMMFSKLGDCFSMSDNFNLFSDSGIDQTSAGRAEMNGQRPVAIVVASQSRSDLEVSDPLVVVTDRGIYTANPRDVSSLLSPKLVSPYGSKCPGGICVGHGAVYYFDTNRQIRRIAADVDSPSRWRVDRLWNGIPNTTSTATYKTFPRDTKVSLEFWDGRLYVAYTPTGEVDNKACSVYDTELDIWYDDVTSNDMEHMFLTPVNGGKDQLRFLTVGDQQSPYAANPKLFQHEDSSAPLDGSSDIIISIQLPYLHTPDFLGKNYNQLGMICTNGGTALSLTITRTGFPLGTTSTGKLFISDTGQSYSYKWDTEDTTNNRTGVFDGAVQYSISGTVLQGFTIYSIVLDVEGAGNSLLNVKGGQNG